MRKLPPGEERRKLGINVKRTICEEFYRAAAAYGFAGIEGRFFDIVFQEWAETKALGTQVKGSEPRQGIAVVEPLPPTPPRKPKKKDPSKPLQ